MLHNLGSEHLNSILTEKLPAILVEPIKSEYVTKSKFKSEIEFEITQINNYIIEIYKDLNKKINDQDKEIMDLKETVRKLEVKNRPKPTPNQERVEILHKKVLKKGRVNTKVTKDILSLPYRKQALRVMRLAAKTYPEDLNISQSVDKTYWLNSRSDTAGHCPADLSR